MSSPKEERRNRTLSSHFVTGHILDGKKELDELKANQAKKENSIKSDSYSKSTNQPSNDSTNQSTDSFHSLNESPNKTQNENSNVVQLKYPRPQRVKSPCVVRGHSQKKILRIFYENRGRLLTYAQIESFSNARTSVVSRIVRQFVDRGLLEMHLNIGGYKSFIATDLAVNIFESINPQFDSNSTFHTTTHTTTHNTNDSSNDSTSHTTNETTDQRSLEDRQINNLSKSNSVNDFLQRYISTTNGEQLYKRDYPWLSTILRPDQIIEALDILLTANKSSDYFIESLQRIDFEIGYYKERNEPIPANNKDKKNIENLDDWYYRCLSKFGRYRIPKGYNDEIEKLAEEEIRLAEKLKEKREMAKKALMEEWTNRLDEVEIEKIKNYGEKYGFSYVGKEKMLDIFWGKFQGKIVEHMKQNTMTGLPNDFPESFLENKNDMEK